MEAVLITAVVYYLWSILCYLGIECLLAIYGKLGILNGNP